MNDAELKKQWFCDSWPTVVDALDYIVTVVPFKLPVKIAVGLIKVIGNSLHKRYCGAMLPPQ